MVMFSTEIELRWSGEHKDPARTPGAQSTRSAQIA